MATKKLTVGATAYVEEFGAGEDRYVITPVTIVRIDGDTADVRRADGTIEDGWHVGNLRATPPLPRCRRCWNARTRKTLCRYCQSVETKRQRELAKLRAIHGTVAAVGDAEAWLRMLPAPDGFEKTLGVDEEFPSEGGWPTATFVGHGGKTTIVVRIEKVDSDWAPGSGHVSFTTARGSFSYDRHGVEDSFYVHAKDTVDVVLGEMQAQVAKVVAARARHETSETVPFVGHVVTPERKAEIAATLKAGRSHNFMPSGFGTGYRCSTRRDAYAKVAPQAMADFFGVPRLYYVEMDCD